MCSGFVVGWFFMCLRLVFSVVWWVGPSDASLNLAQATIVVRIVRESDFTDVVAKG